jgi:hypothetical protein
LKLPADSFMWGDGGSFGGVTPPGLSSVHVNLSVLGQGGTNVVDSTTIVHFKQSTIDDNKLLGLINSEFGTSFSATNGDHLAVSNFWDGKFIVLGQDGTVLLANASANTNGDHYVLDLSHANAAYASIETTNFETKFSAMDGILHYESGDSSNSFRLAGFTTVSDTYSHDFTNSTESFQLSGGIGHASFGTNDVSGVLTGSVYGSGKDNAPAP